MPTVRLDDRAIVSVSGPDAEHLLQNILTTDLEALAPGVAKPGALLTPQGKILFDFLVSRAGADGFDLECRADVADDYMRRLTLYKLRAKAQISKRDQSVVSVAWRDDSAASGDGSTASQIESNPSETDSTSLVDSRFPSALHVRRQHGSAAPADASLDAWARLRIAHGVTESGPDFALGDAFPHDVNLDQFAGVGFRKGCYVGQEVVSRMHHRGTARRRALIAEADGDLPAPGTPVTIDGRPAGALGSVAGPLGLAILRVDKVKDAMDAGTPILAGDVALRLSLPPGATFGFTEAAGDEA
jgi:folate-binding protein YgfZ